MLNIMSEAAAVSEIRKYHPLFKQLSFQGSRMLFRQGKAMLIQPSNIIPNQVRSQGSFSIIIYGNIQLKKPYDIPILINACNSLGEEGFLMNDYEIRYIII